MCCYPNLPTYVTDFYPYGSMYPVSYTTFDTDETYTSLVDVGFLVLIDLCISCNHAYFVFSTSWHGYLEFTTLKP